MLTMCQTLFWTLEIEEHQQNRLNPLTLGTCILVRIAVLTAYFILTVSRVIKHVEVFCRCEKLMDPR